MKKFIAVLFAMLAFSAQATQIQVQFDQPEYAQGDDVFASIWVSDYNDALTYFGLDAFFNALDMSYLDATFSPVLDIPGVPAFNAAWLADDGMVSLFGMFSSILDDELSVLLNQQSGQPLQLVTLKFTALNSLNQATLTLENVDLTFQGLSTPPYINPTPVPAPATALLLLPALALLRRRRV